MGDICTIQLSIGNGYKDSVICDVSDMDACHVLLGRPWQYDLQAVHKGRDNTYEFSWMMKKTVLLPKNKNGPPNNGRQIETSGNLFTVLRGKDILKQSEKSVWGLIVTMNPY